MSAVISRAYEMFPDDRGLLACRNLAGSVERISELLKDDATYGLEHTMAKQAELQAQASHRPNIIAAIFFPILAFAAIFGMNLEHGFEQKPHWFFWLFVAIGIALGIVMKSLIFRTSQVRADKKKKQARIIRRRKRIKLAGPTWTEAEIHDRHVAVESLPWKRARDGLAFKLLRTSPATGTWVTLFRQDAGSSVPPHHHHGTGEYFVIKGCIEVNGGVDNGGVTARAGEYGFEASGMVHHKTYFPVETEYLFIHRGPIEYLGEDGKPSSTMDWRGIQALWNEAEPIGAGR